MFLGYIVVSPDYEGPDAAFPVGRLEGMGVLDSMRAVNNYADELAESLIGFWIAMNRESHFIFILAEALAVVACI